MIPYRKFSHPGSTFVPGVVQTQKSAVLLLDLDLGELDLGELGGTVVPASETGVVTEPFDQPRDLPPYLLRYPNPWGLGHRRKKGLENLRAAVTRYRNGYGGMSFEGLLGALLRFEERSDTDTTLLVDEIVVRLSGSTAEAAEQLAGVLHELHRRSMPRRRCLQFDRALQRVLFLLRGTASYDLAFACLRSERSLRRWAAYKFYGIRGLDDQARSVLAFQAIRGEIEEPGTASVRFYPGSLIAKDAALVANLDLAVVLKVAPTTEMRKIAIEFAMSSESPATVAAKCEDYPQELVWAVQDGCRSEFLPFIMDMIDDYRDDPYLLHYLLRCVACIGCRDDLEYALHVASAVIDLADAEQ
ncbi:hypothetical protein O7626_30675 [Micromonospora sp. WMMD1102]|uniref:hypothetical protein n=1 Tax=Micromonospora sp. WMMD1102 TaxID=3016105 RepID=UPI00241550CD|nr:hypothetical protein [Micromonospora sp. WMMD1102]MDG4790237.1 hypothetical protein [Micromonospora sp. WMMD1102]